jgi:hypothetical protein
VRTATLAIIPALVAASSLADLKLVRSLTLRTETRHVQGIDLDGRKLWVTSVDRDARKGYLEEFALGSGERLRRIDLTDGERFHPGGLSAYGMSLWMPVAEYRRESTAVIQRRNASTLALESQFPVADHIGCVAVGPGFVIGGNWDSRQFYIWDHQGHLLRKAANPTENAYQDMKFVSGKLVASGVLPGNGGAIDWLEYPSLRLLRRIEAGKTDRGVRYTQEGMAVRGDRLFLLPEDGSSRLFEFRLKR